MFLFVFFCCFFSMTKNSLSTLVCGIYVLGLQTNFQTFFFHRLRIFISKQNSKCNTFSIFFVSFYFISFFFLFFFCFFETLLRKYALLPFVKIQKLNRKKKQGNTHQQAIRKTPLNIDKNKQTQQKKNRKK